MRFYIFYWTRPSGIPIVAEAEMEHLIHGQSVDVVVFAYSDVSHPTVMHLASRAVAAGADFWLLATERTQVPARVPVVSVCATRTGCSKPGIAAGGPGAAGAGLEGRGGAPPHALR